MIWLKSYKIIAFFQSTLQKKSTSCGKTWRKWYLQLRFWACTGLLKAGNPFVIYETVLIHGTHWPTFSAEVYSGEIVGVNVIRSLKLKKLFQQLTQ